ncbi:MAG TPA: phage regulatory CII family protein [Candidatus Dormibacteraeota bacterium]|nr:phage regulatory CII family protein [Candidatus Dormibacteraeota bacterium]
MSDENLYSVLSRAVESKAEYDIRLLAQQLGTNYRSLMYWLRGERQIPAYLLPQICLLLKTYEPLDFLESQAGRIGFKIPDTQLTSDKEILAVSGLLREVGEALESVAATLADGNVEESELRVTVPKLEGVIRECASLKYLLEDLCKKRKKKAKH